MKTTRKATFLATSLLAGMLLTGIAHAAEPVDINRADAATLASAIQGVGVKRAEAIVAYREANGPFKSVDELQNVKGVGARILEDSRSSLTVCTR